MLSISYARIWWHARRYQSCEYRAEDLFQDGVVKALEHISSVRDGDAEMQRAFLMRRVAGHMQDIIRTRVLRRGCLSKIHANRQRKSLSLCADENDMKHLVLSLVLCLSTTEQYVIWASFFEEMTLREMGNVLGVCPERIFQIRKQALLKMRAQCLSDGVLSAGAPVA